MPIPRKHRADLEYFVSAHKFILAMASDRKVLAALEELSDDPDLRQEVAKNPTAYLKRKRIVLPRGAKVSLTEGSWRVQVTVTQGKHSTTVGYDSDSGFYSDKK